MGAHVFKKEKERSERYVGEVGEWRRGRGERFRVDR